MDENRMLKWFKFASLPTELHGVASAFWDSACQIVALVKPGPERTVALRKLLEGRDAAIRAMAEPGS